MNKRNSKATKISSDAALFGSSETKKKKTRDVQSCLGSSNLFCKANEVDDFVATSVENTVEKITHLRQGKIYLIQLPLILLFGFFF